jgi:hypothetical protein
MRGSGRAVALAVGLAGIGFFTAAWSAIWLSRGSYMTSLLVVGLSIWGFGFATYFFCTATGAPRPRTASGAAGTVLRPGRFVDTVFIVSISALTITATLYLVFSRIGMVDYVPTGVMRIGVPAGCWFLLIFGVPTLFRTIRHRGGGHLRLDPTGFEVWNGQWGSFRRGSWEEVEQILDHPPRGGRPFNKVIVFVLPKGPAAMLVSDTITRNNRALLDWVRFYWRHPERRDELVDRRGLRRLDDMLAGS